MDWVSANYQVPGNMYTKPKWKAALYIDERATQQQKDLITKIYSGQAGGFFAVVSNLIGEMLSKICADRFWYRRKA